MKQSTFIASFILLMVIQLILAKYCQIAPYIYISLLPALVLCLPTARPQWFVMTVAFACGIATDLLADGVPGLNAAAILPAALLQKRMISIFIDDEMVERGYSFSFRENGYLKILSALTVLYAIYFVIYVIVDNAGQKPAGFMLARIAVSLCISLIFGAVVCGILCPRRKN